MKRFASLAEVAGCVGLTLESAGWVTVSQQAIQQFAEATGDHQWIHVDEARAQAGPFGGTIAHGFLTLSLLPQFLASAFEIAGSGMGVNYGLNKVRFTAPVPAGSRLRATLTLLACEPVDRGGIQMVWQVTVLREGHDRPVCVAESVVRRYP